MKHGALDDQNDPVSWWKILLFSYNFYWICGPLMMSLWTPILEHAYQGWVSVVEPWHSTWSDFSEVSSNGRLLILGINAYRRGTVFLWAPDSSRERERFWKGPFWFGFTASRCDPALLSCSAWYYPFQVFIRAVTMSLNISYYEIKKHLKCS